MPHDSETREEMSKNRLGAATAVDAVGSRLASTSNWVARPQAHAKTNKNRWWAATLVNTGGGRAASAPR